MRACPTSEQRLPEPVQQVVRSSDGISSAYLEAEILSKGSKFDLEKIKMRFAAII